VVGLECPPQPSGPVLVHLLHDRSSAVDAVISHDRTVDPGGPACPGSATGPPPHPVVSSRRAAETAVARPTRDNVITDPVAHLGARPARCRNARRARSTGDVPGTSPAGFAARAASVTRR